MMTFGAELDDKDRGCKVAAEVSEPDTSYVENGGKTYANSPLPKGRLD